MPSTIISPWAKLTIADDAEDDREAERHQPVDGAGQQPGDDDVEIGGQREAQTWHGGPLATMGPSDEMRGARCGPLSRQGPRARGRRRLPPLPKPGIGKTASPRHSPAGSTGDRLAVAGSAPPPRSGPGSGPSRRNGSAPPIMTRFSILVCRSASTSASGLVEPARLSASAQISMPSKEKPTLRSKDWSG